MEIYFLRHGETAYNQMGIVQGSGVDASLNERGWTQARLFFEAHQYVPFDGILTSTLRRTQETVQPFIQKGVLWEGYPQINEINWGIHEGQQSTPTMVQTYQHINEEWSKGNYDARVLEGESAQELGQRVREFFQILVEKEAQCLLVCTHGRTLAAISCYLRGRPLMDMHLFPHHNTGLTHAVWHGKDFEVLRHNDTSHLDE